MTSTQGIHERGMYLAHTSYFMTPTIAHPALGAWVVKLLGSRNSLLPGSVLIHGSPQHPGCGYFPAHLAPLPVVEASAGLQNSRRFADVSNAEWARRVALSKAVGETFAAQTGHRDVTAYGKIREEAVALMKSDDLKVFDISRESAQTQATYGSHAFGKGCLLARRLVESGVRFVEVEDTQNWDTHNDHISAMQRMTPGADQAMAALLGDLHERGLLATTLVVMATEFGRTPQFNRATAGRGHHPGVFTWWLAGAGVRAGSAYGSSDAGGERVEERPVTMADFNATVAHMLGLDLEHIEHSPSGRPFTVADKGRPVMGLIA
jgi:uncharacterized protein (DUF1501 family)